MLSPGADGALRGIGAATGRNKREVIELALRELEKALYYNNG